MYLKNILIMFVALTLLVVMSPVVADHHEENDGLARVVMITPKDGHNKALEEAIVEYHHYMADKKGSWRYQWYSIETGPDTGKYLARSGGHNYEDFDAVYDWEEEAGKKFASLVRPHIDNMVITITKTDDEIGIWPEDMEGYEYYSVTHWHIMPGHYRAFNDGLKKIDATLKEGGWPSYYAFVNPVSGGMGGQTTIVTPRKSFADMAPKEPSFFDVMNKALGEEETAAFMAEWSKTYKSGQNYLLRHMKEQSDYGDGK